MSCPLNEDDVKIIVDLKKALKLDHIPEAEVVEEMNLSEIIRVFFENIGNRLLGLFMPGQLDNIYRKITGESHPSFREYLGYASNFYG